MELTSILTNNLAAYENLHEKVNGWIVEAIKDYDIENGGKNHLAEMVAAEVGLKVRFSPNTAGKKLEYAPFPLQYKSSSIDFCEPTHLVEFGYVEIYFNQNYENANVSLRLCVSTYGKGTGHIEIQRNTGTTITPEYIREWLDNAMKMFAMAYTPKTAEEYQEWLSKGR